MKHLIAIAVILFAIAAPLTAEPETGKTDYNAMTAAQFEMAILDIMIKHPENFTGERNDPSGLFGT